MKQITILLMTFILGFLSCSDGDEDTNDVLVVPDPTQLEQTVYADEESGNGGVTFVAREAWTARIREVKTRAEESQRLGWLSLNQYDGPAGEFTLQITLAVNTTGETRTAEIDIIAGNTMITIRVSQAGTTEKGDVPREVAVDGVILNETSIEIKAGDTTMLVATVTPENATNKKVVWSSSDENVVIVNAETGKVEAIAPGTAVITAVAAADDTKRALCTFTVKDVSTEISYRVAKFNGDTVYYDENRYMIGVGEKMYTQEEGYTIKNDLCLIYVISPNDSRYDYGFNNEYLQEVRYQPRSGVNAYFKSRYTWDAEGNLMAAIGDQVGVSRAGDLTTTFEYSTTEYTLGNINIGLLLATQEYYVGIPLVFFDHHAGKHCKKLISKSIQVDPEDDKYTMNRSFRYVMDTYGRITAIYVTEKWSLEEEAREERLLFSFEY